MLSIRLGRLFSTTLVGSRIHGLKKLEYIRFRNSFITGLCSYLRVS